MVSKSSIIALLLALPICILGNSERLTRSQYIDQWKDVAINQMIIHKIPASITLAQGILESGDGNSELAKKSNNHFGIKCHSDWKGKKVYHDDDRKGECFRQYKNAQESFDDHSQFLKKNRYSSLFELKITDYKSWAKGLKKCGYATNPKYATLLIQIIEKNQLYEFDDIAKAQMNGEVIAENKPKKKKDRNSKIKNAGDEDLPSVNMVAGRQIDVSANRIKFIVTKEGDNFQKIASDLDMMPWQLWKYNDLKKTDDIAAGTMLYIQPKRGAARENEHVFKEDDSMWEISQYYGVKLKKLYKKNGVPFGTEPEAGTVLILGRKS